MIGKELIIYILENNLENEVIIQDGTFVGAMTEEEAAVKFNVGVATIRMWHELQMLKGFRIGGSLFFLKNVTDPRGESK